MAMVASLGTMYWIAFSSGWPGAYIWHMAPEGVGTFFMSALLVGIFSLVAEDWRDSRWFDAYLYFSALTVGPTAAYLGGGDGLDPLWYWGLAAVIFTCALVTGVYVELTWERE